MMPDTTPEQILARAQVPAANGRPVRKDEIELDERGLYIESWLPERRSRRKPLLFVHGELAGSWLWERFLAYFAGRGWEGHALNLRNHYWSQTADPTTLSFESYTDDVAAAIDRLGEGVVVIGHAMGGLLGLKAAGDRPIGGMVLLSPDLPDLTLADVLRIQHLLGQKPHESGLARRQVLQGVSVDRGRFADLPVLVIGGGLDREVPEPGSERLADWLGAQYEPFGAHSHYGL